MKRINEERWMESEWLVQKLSDDHELSREKVLLIVQATFHRLGQLKDERGMTYVSKIITYAPEHKIAKGTWSYLDRQAAFKQ